MINRSLIQRWTVPLFLLGGGAIGACSCEGEPQIGRLEPEIFVEQTSIDFGEVPLGATKDLPLKVENKGNLGLIVCASAPSAGMQAEEECTSLTELTPPGAPFAPIFEGKTDIGTWLVEPTTSREMGVSFTPTAEGPVQAKLVLFHNAVNGPTTEITLTGTGVRPQVDVAPTMIDFGDVTVGQTKRVDLVFTNRTQFAQPIQAGPINQPAIVFEIESAGTDGISLFQVPGNGTQMAGVFFTPIAEGPEEKSFVVRYCPTCEVTVTLRGNGVKPVFEVVPPELNFGTVLETQSAMRTFTIRNIGATALTVERVELNAGTSSEFVIAPAFVGRLPLTMAGGAQETVEVTYTVSSPGTEDPGSSLTVDTNAWDNPDTGNDEQVRVVNLVAVGSGPDINALPRAVNFGTAPIAAAPVTKNLLLENTGNSPLTISNVQINTPTPELAIAMAPGWPQTVAGGSSVQLTLSYAPTANGLDEAQLVVTSDDRDENPLVIPVSGIGGVPTTCAVSITPPDINFGLVERGRRATLPAQINNTGAMPCQVTNIRVMGDPTFTTPLAGTGGMVAPGSSMRVDIHYSPTAYGSNAGQILFDVNDPAQPMVTASLSGTSAPSEIRVIPSELDFSVVPVTCRSPARAVTVYNTGTSAAVVENVYLDPSTSTEFELQPFSTPATVPAGQNVVIRLRYHPADIGSDNGVLFIKHSLSLAPVAVPLIGRGEVSPTVTDRFVQDPTPQADVLFVVDNSCSMEDEQAGLGANLGSFLTYADREMVDYHIAVVTTDTERQGGRFVSQAQPKIIEPTTQNRAQVFATNTDLGTSGSGSEKGLHAAYLALTDPLINDPAANGGFLRPDAALAIIIVSDEQDQSPRDTTFYENFYRNIKGFQNADQFSLSAVVTPSDPPCSGQGSGGSRYIQVAQRTGGVVESICTANWGTTLANIGLNTFGLRRQFTLSSAPVPSTISVKVNGAQVQNVTPTGAVQWRYDMTANTVTFEPANVPDAGVTIEVTYTVACLP